VLFLTHSLVYETWTFSPEGSDIPATLWIKLVLGFLSVSFVAASLLAFRYTDCFGGGRQSHPRMEIVTDQQAMAGASWLGRYFWYKQEVNAKRPDNSRLVRMGKNR
jgi:hypothetical protein